MKPTKQDHHGLLWGSFDPDFDSTQEFVPVSAAEVKRLYKVLLHEKPVIHQLGE